jgi:hypothetical protein
MIPQMPATSFVFFYVKNSNNLFTEGRVADVELRFFGRTS